MPPTKLKSISGHGAKYGPKVDHAILALLSKSSTEAAAHAVGIHVNTLLRWMKEAKFQEAYEHARMCAFSQSIARLQYISGFAVETLYEILRDKKQPGSVRLRAADIILGHAGGGDGMTARAVHIRQLVQSRQ